MIKKRSYISFDSFELHSFDAYYKNVILLGNTLIIPYVNLALFNVNRGSKPEYIDRCYVLLKEIKRLSLYSQENIISNSNFGKYDLFLGGMNLDDKSVFVDMDVICNDGGVYLLEDSKISHELSIPIDTPNFSMNMDPKKVEELFMYKDCKLL